MVYRPSSPRAVFPPNPLLCMIPGRSPRVCLPVRQRVVDGSHWGGRWGHAPAGDADRSGGQVAGCWTAGVAAPARLQGSSCRRWTGLARAQQRPPRPQRPQTWAGGESTSRRNDYNSRCTVINAIIFFGRPWRRLLFMSEDPPGGRSGAGPPG